MTARRGGSVGLSSVRYSLCQCACARDHDGGGGLVVEFEGLLHMMYLQRTRRFGCLVMSELGARAYGVGECSR